MNDRERETRMIVGDLLRSRREAQGLSLSALSNSMGGSPTATFLAKIERGEVSPTPSTASKLAEALRLRVDVVLRANGYNTPMDQEQAREELRDAVSEELPVAVQLPVLTPAVPNADPTRLPKRQRMLRRREAAFIIDLEGDANEPYTGEIIASRERTPKDGQGVIAEVEHRLGAWTYHVDGSISNGSGETIAKSGYQLFGVIIGRTIRQDFD